jgi:hypothetical protein
VGQAAKALRAAWRKRYRFTLDAIFEEYAAIGVRVTPDEALELMEDLLCEWVSKDASVASDGTLRPLALFRFDFAAFRREAHHYAVDQFYKTYFPRRRGAPPLPDYHIDRILALRRKGWNYVAIAKELGQPEDTTKRQVEVAEKRCRERLKERYPQFIAPDSLGSGEKRSTGDKQATGQSKGKPSGK